MRLTLFSLGLGYLGLLALSSCKPTLQEFQSNTGQADFSSWVVLGGSYLSGYTNGGISPRSDSFSIPALMHRSLQALGAPALRAARVGVQGGIGLHAKPWEAVYQSQSTLSFKTDCKGVSALGPVKSIPTANEIYSFEQSVLNVNLLAVPFATMAQYQDPQLGSTQGNIFYRRMASFPGTSTLLGDAQRKNARFFVVWPGMDDVFNWASQGGAVGELPVPATFERQLDSVLQVLTANGAKGVLANVPDFTVMPFYTTVAWNNAELNQGQADTLNEAYALGGLSHIQFKPGRNGFVIADALAPGGFRQLHSGEYITLGVPLDSMKCYKYGLLVNVVHNRYVLDSTEVVLFQQVRQNINQIIAQKAAQYGLALVDVNAYMNRLPQGILADVVFMISTFVSGNFFSLDGYHPTEKGYALLANEFIRAINVRYGSSVPQLHCAECKGVLFP
ncbi:MAG: hypothetical protein FGM54_01505 [Chitinophagaceae bacterium]|nr:hypothetical protein [Chitinophagaceae bacterium]